MSSGQADDLHEAVTAEEPRRLNQRARQKAETRRRLLEAAAEVFQESGGPVAASLDAVAALAGVSRPTLFFHFGSRKELIEQLATHLIETRFAQAADHLSRAGLRPFLKSYLRAQRLPEVRLLWLLGEAYGLDRPEGSNLAYWLTISEIEKRLFDGGCDARTARDLALVLGPGLMLVANRAAYNLTTDEEERNFVERCCALAERLGAIDPRGTLA